MSKKDAPESPDLVPVHELAKDRDVSSTVMRRRLLRLEKSLGRKILHKGDRAGDEWLADRSYLSRMANDAGKNVWNRLRAVESELADVKTELGEVRRILAENGFVA